MLRNSPRASLFFHQFVQIYFCHKIHFEMSFWILLGNHVLHNNILVNDRLHV